MKVCFLNDTFPPCVDGVATAVCNYAKAVDKAYGNAIAAVPYYPDANDGQYPFPVIRFGSIRGSRFTWGYRIGNFLSRHAAKQVSSFAPDILHCHAPGTSLLLGKRLRKKLNVPLILTYHTKFEIEIKKEYKFKPVCKVVEKIAAQAIRGCDEVWAVSEGAAQSLRSIGYKGNVVIMRNGVDMPKGKSEPDDMEKLRRELDLPDGVIVYLFVGRMFWYKGIKIIIDALSKLKSSGKDYRMIFVGDGAEKSEIMKYAEKTGIAEKCIFTGPIFDRNVLRAFYSISDLHIFPSTYDTFSLTVHEALACGCPSLLIKGSSAAEPFSDTTALLAKENADSVYEKLIEFSGHDAAKRLSAIGENAMNTLYFSWEDAVGKAVERYRSVISNYHRTER